MRVLTTRGGELATVFGPICSNPACGCGQHAVGLDSGYPVDEVTVAERDGFTLADLRSACAAFLVQRGWTDEDDEHAEMASDEAAEMADGLPVGTRLAPRYDYGEERYYWDFLDDDDQAELTLIEVLT